MIFVFLSRIAVPSRSPAINQSINQAAMKWMMIWNSRPFLALWSWSTNSGTVSIGTPAWDASLNEFNPEWLMNPTTRSSSGMIGSSSHFPTNILLNKFHCGIHSSGYTFVLLLNNSASSGCFSYFQMNTKSGNRLKASTKHLRTLSGTNFIGA